MDPRPTYDEKLRRILKTAAGIFAEKGYHPASIRDISAATGASLSGLYYYFSSKEELLFLIQEHCFRTLLEQLRTELARSDSPEERLRIFVRKHLGFFAANMPEMKVLSHEADVLGGEYSERVLELKRAYTAEVRAIVEALLPQEGIDARVATFSLFGMMNWIYNWYRPGRDVDADRLATEMVHLFLRGVRAPVDAAGPLDEDTVPLQDRSSFWPA